MGKSGQIALRMTRNSPSLLTGDCDFLPGWIRPLEGPNNASPSKQLGKSAETGKGTALPYYPQTGGQIEFAWPCQVLDYFPDAPDALSKSGPRTWCDLSDPTLVLRSRGGLCGDGVGLDPELMEANPV